MVGVHQGVATAGEERPETDRVPRAPWAIGNVDRQLIAPVAVDSRRTHPLAGEIARLHRVLDEIPIDDRHGVSGGARPPVGGAILGRRGQPSARHPRQPHRRGRMWAIPEATLADHVLLEGVAEQVGVGVIAARRVAVDRRHTTVGCQLERLAHQRRRVVARQVRPDRMPPETERWVGVVRVLDHLDPEHPQPVVGAFATHRPPPRRSGRRATVSDLERSRRVGGAPMEQRETRLVLDERRVVHEIGRRQRGRGARVVDEGILEQPEIPATAERVDVLVIPAEHGSDTIGQEAVDLMGRRAGRASDVGADMTTGGDRCRRCPRWRRDRRRRWRIAALGQISVAERRVVGVDIDLVIGHRRLDRDRVGRRRRGGERRSDRGTRVRRSGLDARNRRGWAQR